LVFVWCRKVRKELRIIEACAEKVKIFTRDDVQYLAVNRENCRLLHDSFQPMFNFNVTMAIGVSRRSLLTTGLQVTTEGRKTHGLLPKVAGTDPIPSGWSTIA
jgi:hypothetical protein